MKLVESGWKVACFLVGVLLTGGVFSLFSGDYVAKVDYEKFVERANIRHEVERDVRTEILANQADMGAKLEVLIDEVRRLRDQD